jgi:two-component system sensor histidine kinase BarA
VSYTQGKREQLLATAQVFGAASARAVSAEDAAAVLLAIRAIARVPGVAYAEVEDRRGAVLADLGTAVRLEGDADITVDDGGAPLRLLASRTVRVSVPVLDGGETVGRLTLVSDTSDLFDRFRQVIATAALGAALAGAIGLIVSIRLQRSITRPLVALTEAMARIQRSHDYGTSVPIRSDDEVGCWP